MIVVDTHALVWWVSGDTALSVSARSAIEQALSDGKLIVSAMTAWEIAMLAKTGRLVLSMDTRQWLDTVAAIEGLRIWPVDMDIALKSVGLPDPFHKDPADRMIVATARALAAPLVTRDEKIRAYPHVRTLW